MTVFDDDADVITEDETTVVRKIGRLLDEAVSPCKRPRLLTHTSYLDRLKTFSPSTYFAKPIEISPIICATRGYVRGNVLHYLFSKGMKQGFNRGVYMDDKHAKCIIHLVFHTTIRPSPLVPKIYIMVCYPKTTRVLQESWILELHTNRQSLSFYNSWANIGTDLLQCSHCNAKLAITFDSKLNPQQCRTVTQKHQEALATKGHVNELCLFYDTTCSKADPLGQFSSALLDPDFIQIMESSPSSLVVERAKKLLQGDDDDDLPTVVKFDDDALLEQAVAELSSSCSSGDSRSALALTLLGWSRGDGGNPHHLSCKLCLSIYNNNNNNNLVTSHKYYCPYLLPPYGKEEEEPCWKQICKRILEEASAEPNNNTDEDDPDAAVARIQRLLNQ